MLDSLVVKNFRLFEQLEIRDLGRVNLVVGRNNSGKSTLLEALRLFGASGARDVVFDLITARQEQWDIEGLVNVDSPSISPVRHLFHNRALPKPGENGIVVGPIIPRSEQLTVAIEAFKTEMTDDHEIAQMPIENGEQRDDVDGVELGLVARQNGAFRRLFLLGSDWEHSARRLSRTPRIPLIVRTGAGTPTVAIPATGITDSDLGFLWDRINFTGLDEEVIRALQIVERRITGITFVDSMERSLSRRTRIPIVKLENAGPLPLKSLGDGPTRVLQIAVALVNAQNGMLLIDEFENGLHWSVQPQIWKTIFRLAERLDVQVFATTHSRDCIKGYEEAWRENEHCGVFFRLNVTSDRGVVVTQYSSETLYDAIEMQVEVR